MTVRERNLMSLLIAAAALVGGGIVFMAWFWEPLQAANRQARELNGEIEKQEQQILMLRQEQKRLAKYKAFSLPSATDQAESDYIKFLSPLLKESGLTVDNLTGPPPGSLKNVAAQAGKKAAHVPLTFNVRARGDVASLIKSIEKLRRAPVTHRVKSIALTPTEATGKDTSKLSIQMTIEALIVHKANSANPFLNERDNRLVILEGLSGLRLAPVGLALGPWNALKEANKRRAAVEDPIVRDYSNIRSRDIFVGGKAAPPPVFVAKEAAPTGPPDQGFEVFEYVRLVHTSQSANEAWLRNLIYHEIEQRIRPGKPGYQIFQIKTEDKAWVLLRAKALRVDQRELFFQVGEKVYRMHIGATLKEALARSLRESEIEALELTDLFDEEFAEEEEAKALKKSGGKTKAPKSR